MINVLYMSLEPHNQIVQLKGPPIITLNSSEATLLSPTEGALAAVMSPFDVKGILSKLLKLG